MRTHALRITALLVGAALAQQAWASGYHFGTQSVSAQGTANASGAAADDVTTIFSNPAGLTHIDGDNFAGVLDIVVPHGDFTDGGSHTYLGQTTGGQSGGNFTKTTVVPHAYLSHKINSDLTVGFGAFVPFGSDVEYASNWAGRYDVLETKLETLALNPSFAWRVNPTVSIGGGITAQYNKGKLVKGADFGTVSMIAPNGNGPSLAQQLQGALTQAQGLAAAAQATFGTSSAQYQQAAAAVQALTGLNSSMVANLSGNPTYDGQVDVNGDDWGYGFNMGVLFDIDPHTRVGVAYRSKIQHKLNGTANWTVPQTFASSPVYAQASATLAALGTNVGNLGQLVQNSLNSTFSNGGASIAVDTPESLSLSVYRDINDKLALMADVTRTKHSRLQAINVQFANGLAPANIPENWADTTKYSVGGTYKYSDQLKLRAGFMYDQSPVSDSNRTPALPDGDRKWVSLGFNWAFSKASSVDFAYSYVQIGTVGVHNFDNGGVTNASGQQVCDQTKNTSSCSTTIGQDKVYSHLVGLQYNYHF